MHKPGGRYLLALVLQTNWLQCNSNHPYIKAQASWKFSTAPFASPAARQRLPSANSSCESLSSVCNLFEPCTIHKLQYPNLFSVTYSWFSTSCCGPSIWQTSQKQYYHNASKWVLTSGTWIFPADRNYACVETCGYRVCACLSLGHSLVPRLQIILVMHY